MTTNRRFIAIRPHVSIVDTFYVPILVYHTRYSIPYWYDPFTLT